MDYNPPHLTDRPAVTSKRGFFWIPGERIVGPAGTQQAGPLYVEWEAPETVTKPYPLVLIHGGGGQGTDWKGTPDGRPGWVDHFVAAGFAVYNVDRPGHGRSPHHPDVLGPAGDQFSYEFGQWLFAPGDKPNHVQWPWSREIGGAEFDQVLASSGSLPGDIGAGQAMDAERISRLLDIIGPSVLITHSAGGPAGWLTANLRPDLVKAISAGEPMGPPFANMGMGVLEWGLTFAPIEFDPPVSSPDELNDGVERVIPGLAGLPISVVTSDESIFATYAQATVDFLKKYGADAEWVYLPDHGITGNGHAYIFEINSDKTIVPVIEWIDKVTGVTPAD
jgi:pimeloyl-ACP methyl ester carboxylesterase